MASATVVRRSARAAPLELVTPATASAASSASSARARSSAGSGSPDPRRSSAGSSPSCRKSRGARPAIRVFGRFASHRQAALDQRRQGFVGEVGRSDGRGAPANEQTQADLLAFGPIEAFELAEPHLHARRAVADIEGVGGGRAGRDAALDQRFGDFAGGVGGLHRPRA